MTNRVLAAISAVPMVAVLTATPAQAAQTYLKCYETGGWSQDGNGPVINYSDGDDILYVAFDFSDGDNINFSHLNDKAITAPKNLCGSEDSQRTYRCTSSSNSFSVFANSNWSDDIITVEVNRVTGTALLKNNFAIKTGGRYISEKTFRCSALKRAF